MSRRLPACDPCRLSKLSCDHEKPVCLRCRTRGMVGDCSYRERPFKKRKTQNLLQVTLATPQSASPQSAPAISTDSAVSNDTSRKSRRYPNPGYLGSSSHTTFFDHLSGTNRSREPETCQEPVDQIRASGCSVNDEMVKRGSLLLEKVLTSAPLSAWEALVGAWVRAGINLPVAEPFTLACAAVSCSTIHQHENNLAIGLQDFQYATTMSRRLFSHSCRPLTVGADDTMDVFRDLFCKTDARWETLGFFFTAVSRATIDIACFDGLYTSEQERRALRKLTMQYSDACLDIVLSLDCLNDLQVILQYENFILHSLVDGDQSYHSWRKLGDVISSLFALGYHEQLGDVHTTPEFLRELRFVAFSRTYSADKNCSIFLGRPPRMSKRYCPTTDRPEMWHDDERFTYRADTRVHGVCASLKEDILDLKREDQTTRLQKASIVRLVAASQWAAIPEALRLQIPLSSCSFRPVELDFLVSARLNFAHVTFLLELTITPRVSHPGVELLRTSADMLSIIVEAVVLKQRLANSGTSLVWKVAYYGLAAAGVLCLALLYNTFDRAAPDATPSKTIRDLSVLVAEIETGALLQPEDPNYALLSGAARTIKNLLDRLITTRFSVQPDIQPNLEASTQAPFQIANDGLSSWDNNGLQDFDPAFWLNLSEHPFLMTPEAEQPTFPE